jgi:hypothetical protein
MNKRFLSFIECSLILIIALVISACSHEMVITTPTVSPTPAPASTSMSASAPVTVSTPADVTIIQNSPSITGNAKSGPSGTARFIFSATLPEPKGKVKIYQLVKPSVTADSVALLGAKLGFTGKTGAFNNGIGMSNPEKHEALKVDVKSGMIDYSRLSEMMPTESPELPAGEEASAIASAFLKESGLWFPDIAVKEVVIGGTFNGQPQHLLVRFSRTIDGLPMTGQGNKFGVRVGNQSKVISFIIYHPEAGAYREVQSIEPALAYDKLQAGEGNIFVPDQCQTVNIKECFLGYSVNSGDAPEYLIPVYAFTGECLDKDGKFIQEFNGWVDATVP